MRQKKKGAESLFHHFILKFQEETEDTEGEADMEKVAHFQFYIIHTEQGQKVLSRKHLVSNQKNTINTQRTSEKTQRGQLKI